MITGRILIVDDEPEMAEALAAGLTAEGHHVVVCETGEGALEALAAGDLDVVLTDLRMRGTSGIELCRHVVSHRPDLPVIVMTAFGNLDTAVAALRAGAFDMLTKPFEMEELCFAAGRALQHRRLREEVRRLREEIATTHGEGEILGSSPPMVALRQLVERVARSDATALITGESGCGKEVVARAIHARSARSAGPLVTINCAAMPEALLESELFGHVRGAFTDAKSSRRGLFLEATGGTLFLDELGELPLGVQAKLLRAIEARCVRPVGGNAEVPFDVRLVAATNRDLEAAVAAKAFREDLYYRVNVVHVEVPPLRGRGNDVLALAQHFVVKSAARHGKAVTNLSPAVAERLLAYPWPGNVRELLNCIERAVALSAFEHLSLDDLPPRVRDHKPSQVVLDSGDPAEFVTLEALEARYVQKVYAAVDGNKRLAARILGVDRTTLYRKLAKYGLHRAT
ncbi:MAG TPA: sigma-54 dependent transcriptional regulator [Labilithrix sp.]|nr:sigma-54 dependent transcriptional regulator [Labilithrix sp.]